MAGMPLSPSAAAPYPFRIRGLATAPRGSLRGRTVTLQSAPAARRRWPRCSHPQHRRRPDIRHALGTALVRSRRRIGRPRSGPTTGLRWPRSCGTLACVDTAPETVEPAPLPVACTLSAGDGRERLRRWQRLEEMAAPVASLQAGRLSVRYQPLAGVAEELAELAAAEQICCPFVSWEVTVTEGQLMLRVTAPADTPEAVAPIAALFGVAAA